MLLDLTDFDQTEPPEDLELFAVLAIMQAVFRPDVADRILRIYQKIKHKLSDPHYHNRWLRILRYVMSSSKYLSKQDFIEVTNQMSETDVATISPLFQELMAEGEVIGFGKGEVIGCEKGEVMREAKSIIRTLTKRFQTVSPTTNEMVFAISDLDELERLADFAYDCQSLAEFETALNK